LSLSDARRSKVNPMHLATSATDALKQIPVATADIEDNEAIERAQQVADSSGSPAFTVIP